MGGVLLSLLINTLLLRFSKSLGIRNKNDVIVRWSNESKPSLGGISMYVTFLFAVLFFAAAFSQEDVFENAAFLTVLAASSLAFTIGLADDAYNTRPLLKLSGQIICGVIFVIGGVTIDLFHHVYFDAAFTILWVVVLMNSLNMLDNMDGITGTVSFFVLLSCAVSFLIFNGFVHNYWIYVLIAILGAIIGFMRYNISPSKMFMGDAGSQFISLVIAFFSIDGFWNIAAQFEVPSWSSLLLVLTVFTPAAVDTLTVVINRLKKGQSPMVGGKDHTTHHLVYKGLSDFKVWLVFLGLSVLSALIAIILLILISMGYYQLTLLGFVFFIIVFYFLYRNTIKHLPKENKS